MKTIEERAKEIFDDAFDADEIIPVREGYIVEQQRRGYRIGATEQKKIDDAELHQRFEKVLNGQKWDLIDKACEWFTKYLFEIGYPDDWCRDSEVQESGEKRFRNIMKD